MSKLTNKDNLEKLAQALDARSKALVKSSVAEESARAQGIEADLQEQIEETQDMFGGKAIRYVTQAEYNQLTDEQKNDPTVVYFIIDAEDLSHTHANKELLDKFGSRTLTIGNKGKTFDGSANVSWTLAEIGAAPSSHNHDDRYFTESEINTKVTDLQAEIDADVKVEADRAKAAEAALQAAIDGKAGSVHNHDDRYFTETEINKIVTDLQAEIDADVLVEKNRAEGAEIYIQTLLEEKAPKTHNHDDRYFTETEVTNKLNGLKEDLQEEIDADVLVETNRAKGIENALQSAIDGKAPKSHAHDDLYYTETEIDSLAEEIRAEIDADVLTEKNRAVAIENALQAAVDGKAPKSHGNHVPTTQTASNKVFLRNDNTWATITPANIGAAASSHAHDDKYYTETEIDAKIATLNNAINDKASDIHNHDDLYYTETEVNTIVADLQAEIDADVKAEADRAKGVENSLQSAINGKANSSHNHDDRYYTETEINNTLANFESAINEAFGELEDAYEAADIALQTAIDSKSPLGHSHDDRYFTETEVTNRLAEKSDVGHDHADLYYDKDEMDTRFTNMGNAFNGMANSLANKADKVHTHDDRYYTETEIDEIVEGIQEDIADAVEVEATRAKAAESTLQANIDKKANTGHTHDDRYFTETEINNKLAGYSATGHNHDDKYYTETEIDAKVTTLQSNIDGKANKSHGNHVPTVETANNARFLRNDNTWQTITPSNIGAAASSHGTHVELATATPKVASGSGAVGTSSKQAREDHVHPVQTTVSGNAGSATKLETARNIVIGNQTNSFNGTANITYTADKMGLVRGGNITATTAATSQWYRIASTTTSGRGAQIGLFFIKANLGSNHCQALITVGTSHGQNPTIQQLAYTRWTSGMLTKARIVYLVEDSGTTAHLEVFTKAATATPIEVEMIGDTGWKLVAPSTVGSVPEGYKSKELTFAPDKIVANINGSVSGNAGSATKLATGRDITIGNQTQNFNGTANITFTLGEIGASASGHTHDDRYYTESEINTKVSNLQSEIDADVKVETDRAKAAENTLQANIDKKANASHGNHVPATQTASNKVFLRNDNTWATVTPANIGAAASVHSHDDLYYTETEIDSKVTTLNDLIDGKADKSHGNHVPATQTANNAVFLRNDNTWQTVTPDNIGAAKASHGTHVTYASATPKANGTAAIGSSGKVAREDHVHPLQTEISGNAGSADVLSTPRNITIGNQTNAFDGSENITYTLSAIGASAEGHNHDGRYYTESEINTKVSSLQSEIDADVKVETDRAKAAENALQANIDKKSDSGHTHTNFAIKLNGGTTEGTNLFTYNGGTAKTVNITPSGIGASATGHTHDDRYFTETEINAKITTINNSIATAKSDAQKYADNQIAALVGSAPETLNTLQELSKAITDHEDVYDAYVVEMDSKLAGKSDTGHTHNYAGSSSAGGAATSANKVNQNLIVKLNGGSTEGTNLFTFNGSAAKTINITPGGIGAANASHGTHVTYSTATPKANGTASVGSLGEVARADHIHPLQTTVSGNAGSADKLSTARTITIGNKSNTFDGTANITYTLAEIGAAESGHTHKYAGSSSVGGAANSVANSIKVQLNGGTTEGTNQFTFNGSAAKTINITYENVGAAKASHGTHVTYATATPLVASTGAVGTSSKVAREDHVHPAQTSVTGNAGTATKLQTARTITVNGVVKGSASFDGSQNITITTSANDITAITKSLTVGADWMDTGITGSHLSTGTYAVQMYANCQGTGGLWREYFSGIMSWVAEGTNSSEADEISLHKAGHAPNGQHIYLRTKRNNNGSLVLQIAAKTAITTAISFEFKFKKLI